MGYIILIVLFVFILGWVEKRTFRWEAVVKYLWKQIYWKADQLASHMKQFNITDLNEPHLEGFKGQIEIRGKLVNSILDFVNVMKKEDNEDAEEETFGYGRYDFARVLDVAIKHPEFFRKLK